MTQAARVSPTVKTPRQARSRQTVERLLGAAAQVFSDRGYAGTTTNHIAAAAGVSVGSLYQYFPSKDAILVALAEQHVEKAFQSAMAKVAEKRTAPVRELLRALVDALIEAHLAEPRLHRVIFLEARLDPGFADRLDELDSRAMLLARELVEERASELTVDNPKMASLMVVQLLQGLTHVMAVRHPEVLAQAEFRDEFVRVLESYLLGGEARK